MAQKIIDNDSLIAALFDVFRDRGYEGATLSQLSRVTGLQKSSLYHRFPAGKVDMARAVVLGVRSQLHEQIIKPLGDAAVAPEIRFANQITRIREFYADGRKNCILNVLNLDGGDTEIRAMMRQDFDAWRDALTALAEEKGVSRRQALRQAEHFLITLEGALVIQRLTGDEDTLLRSLELEQDRFFE